MTDSTKAPKTTSAQRQAALRQRARSLAYGLDDDDIRTAPDTALLEALAIAYRAQQTAPIEGIVVELLHRLGRQVKLVPVDSSSVTVTSRGYPSEVRRAALDMADEGKSSREIQAAIMDMAGRAPAVSNVQKLLKGWRSALD